LGIFFLSEEYGHEVVKQGIAKDHLAKEMKKDPYPGHLVIPEEAFQLDPADGAGSPVGGIGGQHKNIAADPKDQMPSDGCFSTPGKYECL
jgi:hypothetical protein